METKDEKVLKEPFAEIGTKMHLLLHTGQMLMENGADSDRTVRDMMRTAAYMGIPKDRIHQHVMYTTLMLNVNDEQHSYTEFRKCTTHGINMTTLTAISKLTWRALEKNYSLHEFERHLLHIKNKPRNYPVWLTAFGAGAEGREPDRIVARLVLDVQEMALEFMQRVILLECAPGQLADGRQRRHVDAVRRALAELRVRVLLVVDVEHQRRIHDMLVDAVFRDAHVGRGAHHVAHRAVAVRAVLHQHLARVQQEMHLRADFGEGLLEHLFVFRLHDPAPFFCCSS